MSEPTDYEARAIVSLRSSWIIVVADAFAHFPVPTHVAMASSAADNHTNGHNVATVRQLVHYALLASIPPQNLRHFSQASRDNGGRGRHLLYT